MPFVSTSMQDTTTKTASSDQSHYAPLQPWLKHADSPGAADLVAALMLQHDLVVLHHQSEPA